MNTTWVVAADSSRVRIFETSARERVLHEIEDMVNPQGRASNRDLGSDSRGRYYGRGGSHQGNTGEPDTDPVEHEIEIFSREVTKYLDRARTEHRYDKLCLIAPAKFLGLLRRNLSKEAQRLVGQEVTKDITALDPSEIERYVARKH